MEFIRSKIDQFLNMHSELMAFLKPLYNAEQENVAPDNMVVDSYIYGFENNDKDKKESDSNSDSDYKNTNKHSNLTSSQTEMHSNR